MIMSCSLVAAAQEDTIAVRTSQDNPVIAEEVPIGIKDGKVHLDFDIPFYRRFEKDREEMELHMLGIGALKSFSPAPYSFNALRSLDIFAYGTDDISLGRSWLFSWGAGIAWKTFTLTGDTAMYKTDDGKIATGPYPEGSVPKLSRLRVFSFGFPLLFSCNVWNGFGFSLGPIVNLNVDSCINKKYYVNGAKQKDKYKHTYCNLVTADLMFQLNLKEVALWVKYSPVNLMDRSYWPEIQTVSFGIAL